MGAVTSVVLPSIRKYGQYKLFDNPNNNLFKIQDEFDLNVKVVQYIRRYYPKAILVASLGENQTTEFRRINSWCKGYMKGTPDFIIMNNHKHRNGLCIEFKNPSGKYAVSESQLAMKERYTENNFKFILSNDYDDIIMEISKYMADISLPCPLCIKKFKSNDTLSTHREIIHRDKNNTTD